MKHDILLNKDFNNELLNDIERHYILTTVDVVDQEFKNTLFENKIDIIMLKNNSDKKIAVLFIVNNEDRKEIFLSSYDNINFNHIKYIISKMVVDDKKIYIPLETHILKFYDQFSELNKVNGDTIELTSDFLESIRGFELTEEDEVVEFILDNFKENRRIAMIDNIINTTIYNIYPEHKQRNAALGMYGEDYKNTMLAFISDIINKGKVLKADKSKLYIDLLI